jgi:phenylacetate-CoA ligase
MYPFYRKYLRQFEDGIPVDTTATELRRLLEHARANVAYYADLIPGGPLSDPFEILGQMPLLTKEVIRRDFSRLRSADIGSRNWYFNASGGSTGMPVRLVQDSAYAARMTAITLLFSHLAGRDFGQSEVCLWGSERDILQNGQGAGAWIRSQISNTTTVNAFRMTREVMVDLIEMLNRRPPRLLLAYAQAAFEVAAFAEREGISVRPQRAVMTSAGALYPLMRETIERVFGCRVFNRYGAREIGDMACEIPQCEGMWIAPWGVHIEVLDDAGNAVPDGTEGELVVTLLTNYAMPLLRFRIGDRGALAPAGTGWQGNAARMLLRVTGRTVDNFRLSDGTVIGGEYFINLLDRLDRPDWVSRFQVIQKSYASVLVRIVRCSEQPGDEERQIVDEVRAVMGDGCRVDFEYCDRIEPAASGKYRYTISEVS